ncbi:hypothetical protein JRQ81_011932 [Phrynocephalus forsythii]|uniref:Uncharacterized protein n=1 Tax=Phrynocephalus forsythii TaxID=171643 RepID=A0A9Q1AQL0_9SAUR|nr:hypothetical protein JRQ81_011932 [Phrynocephalus forsythii]
MKQLKEAPIRSADPVSSCVSRSTGTSRSVRQSPEQDRRAKLPEILKACHAALLGDFQGPGPRSCPVPPVPGALGKLLQISWQMLLCWMEGCLVNENPEAQAHPGPGMPGLLEIFSLICCLACDIWSHTSAD